jgi:dihydroorotate dehydrogenase
MYPTLRKLLFQLDPERAHALTLTALRFAGALGISRSILALIYAAPPRPVTVFGMHFQNPIGLAAGYDKDAVAVRGLAALGFGHVEVGTVTPVPQSGNPKPRLFRLVEDEALINRMGFPSRGSAYVQKRLEPRTRGGALLDVVTARRPPPPGGSSRSLRRTVGCIIGVNLGKNDTTPNDQAAFDYLELLQNFAPHADYLTINVSSPNTVGLRDLQGRRALEGLLKEMHAQRLIEQEQIKRRLRLLVKLAPDLTDTQLDEAVGVIVDNHMDGIIVTNTTLARDGLTSPLRDQHGGLSGPPLRKRSESMLSRVLQRVDGAIPVVSAGGISGPDDVQRRLDMGAALVQIYTALVYRGPGVVRQMLRGIRAS